MKPKDKKLVDKLVATILEYVAKGITLQVDYVPSIIEGNFGVKSHIFDLAVKELRHKIKVNVSYNGYYRQASSAHDWQADTYSFPAGPDTLRLPYADHFLGRNGGPKKKGSQWRESLRVAKRTQAHKGV